METFNSGEFFAKKIWFLLQECHFSTFTPENEFFQMLMIIVTGFELKVSQSRTSFYYVGGTKLCAKHE